MQGDLDWPLELLCMLQMLLAQQLCTVQILLTQQLFARQLVTYWLHYLPVGGSQQSHALLTHAVPGSRYVPPRPSTSPIGLAGTCAAGAACSPCNQQTHEGQQAAMLGAPAHQQHPAKAAVKNCFTNRPACPVHTQRQEAFRVSHGACINAWPSPDAEHACSTDAHYISSMCYTQLQWLVPGQHWPGLGA